MRSRCIALLAALLAGNAVAANSAELPDCTGAAKLKLTGSSHDEGSASWFWSFELENTQCKPSSGSYEYTLKYDVSDGAGTKLHEELRSGIAWTTAESTEGTVRSDDNVPAAVGAVVLTKLRVVSCTCT